MRTYDNFYWYADKWLIQMINELQLLFVTSLYNAISKLVIALNTARWLHVITKLVESTSNQAQADAMATAAHTFSAFTRIVTPAPLQSPLASTVRMPPRRKWTSSVESAGHKFLVIWGALLLVVHVYAALLSDPPQCRLHSHPWFSMKPGCSLLEFNCIQENIAGKADEIGRLLQWNLNYLLAMKIFNVSTLEWGENAALTNSYHPAMQIVYLVEVNMAELPQGLLAADYPQILHQVMISRANLTFLPDNLDTIWPKGMFLLLEECRFTESPEVIPRMQPRFLSLALNSFSSIPDTLFEERTCRC